MKDSDFGVFSPFFKPTERWGDISKVKWYHVYHLYQIRKAMGLPMVIHCCYADSGHAPNSYHYQGLATDFHFITKMDFSQLVKEVMLTLDNLKLSDFCGLGIYPQWNNPGFHFDSRGESVIWTKWDNQYHYGIYNLRKFIKI
jgi:uncharacterized protein YcbK (DUF882 family)